MQNLGKKAKDKVTGFEGIIVGKTSYLFGCNSYGITPAAAEGKVNDTCWFDEGRIEILGDGILPSAVQAEKNGGLGACRSGETKTS
jgi:hypothetical protein